MKEQYQSPSVERVSFDFAEHVAALSGPVPNCDYAGSGTQGECTIYSVARGVASHEMCNSTD